MSQDKKAVAETKLSLSEEKNLGFIESIAKTNTKKITREILEGLSEDTGDSDSYDVESGGEDSEDRPWRPSHAVFGKSTIKQSHLDNMRGRYFRDVSIVRADNEDKTSPTPEENEVVIFRSFFKVGLRFPLSSFVVEVLKIFQIFLHQITPEAIMRMRVFVWAVRSQGLEPSAKSFCSMHELLYETKPWGKEQYHNNFGCYSFVARSGSSCPVPTFRKRWPGDWIWPLVADWEMPKEAIGNPHEGGLVRLKYTFRFGDQFIEPDDDWLKCVEATSDELLGSYSKAEDNAQSAAFGSRKKKRLDRVFDAIGFMYPDYCYLSWGQKRKSATSGKDDASAAPSEPAPKRKKVKVLTYRLCFIEPAIVPEFGGETSSATEAKDPAVTQKTEKPAAMPKASPAKSGEPKAINIE
jgi:hypothetical protein